MFAWCDKLLMAVGITVLMSLAAALVTAIIVGLAAMVNIH